MNTHLHSPTCRRCGQCCLKGGPALHLEDLPLLAAGVLKRARLMTLRAGEPVHENVAGKVTELDTEIVKVAGGGAGFACGFLDPRANACLIHENRPAECRALFCEDTSAIEGLYLRGRLTRADIVDTGGGLWELVEFHGQAFPAAMAASLARQAWDGSRRAIVTLTDLVEAEQSFRRAFLDRTGVTPEELDFYFGRSLARICAPFGVTLPE
ncbi:MAG: YkgJ family cysteine cluster protein [Thermodesulfobacteriota bacterium]